MLDFFKLKIRFIYYKFSMINKIGKIILSPVLFLTFLTSFLISDHFIKKELK